MPVDIALVSSTSLSSQGRKKDWATPDRVGNIVKTLEIVYYTLYSLDALLCLLVIPFTYFLYEEYDEDAAEHGEQTFGQRVWGAFKYTIAFILFIVLLFLVGFFVRFAKKAKGDDRLDLEFFKHLLSENRGERALSFALGLLMLVGTVLYVFYTGAAVFRPLKLLGGLILMLLALLIFASMLITGIDKAKNSICGAHCGYILGHINIFQPVNWIFVKSSKVFPIDYVLFLLLVLFFFSASVVGIATVGIRFLWLTIFKIRKGHTSPQALLMATVMLNLIVLAINYSVAMVVAPQYATFGPQTFCDRTPRHPGEQPDCSDDKSRIIPCTELSSNPAAKEVCTPSVLSTFINRVTINFPFFGVVLFWGQFAFLGIYLIVFVTTLFRTPSLDQEQLDRDLEEEEEEGLLASTGRRFNATWQDITGRGRRDYGTSESN
ncbi:hypothetical protein DM02DRAFT_608298 [Periconia macrospinosa]|uniref:Lysosomal cobalamin transporter n=1 Tax=Periconia macrospinosa TaxID=97972 RepID=A0A2V1EDN4_9PLEO|nr:hypothetical protein DM02DRAFT_608298 [Periconia macrospinosa]